MSLKTTTALLLSLSIALSACSSAPADRGAHLYEGFDNYHRTVTTSSPEAQRWFDQGMQFLYGFNHDEAVRSFEQAALLDPDCAMAWWGMAYAHGMHINNPTMSVEASQAAFEAASAALARWANASPVEQALIEAVTKRYEWPAPADRAALEVAYAQAMEDAWKRFPDDADVGALFAESLMDLQPWDYWTAEGEPKGRTSEILAALERAIQLDPDHPGANHFYIHAVEASKDPARGVRSAEVLVDLVLGAGHLVHMPSHIFMRVGRYADAADANVRAIAADELYLESAPAPEFYNVYYVHNLHFLCYAAMMECRYETAIAAARKLEADIPEDFLQEWTHVADGFLPTTWHVMIRFGRWEDVLSEPEPPAYRKLSRAMLHYARAIALANLGRSPEARAELAAFDAAAAEVPADWVVGNNKASTVMPLARAMAEGEILFHEGARDEAFASLRAAVALEDQLVYDEPPGWMQPVRHALGALLVADGRYEEALAVYTTDLERNPGNGWSLLGQKNALAGLGRTAEAESAALAVEAAWPRADQQPSTSCYCAESGA